MYWFIKLYLEDGNIFGGDQYYNLYGSYSISQLTGNFSINNNISNTNYVLPKYFEYFKQNNINNKYNIYKESYTKDTKFDKSYSDYNKNIKNILQNKEIMKIFTIYNNDKEGGDMVYPPHVDILNLFNQKIIYILDKDRKNNLHHLSFELIFLICMLYSRLNLTREEIDFPIFNFKKIGMSMYYYINNNITNIIDNIIILFNIYGNDFIPKIPGLTLSSFYVNYFIIMVILGIFHYYLENKDNKDNKNINIKLVYKKDDKYILNHELLEVILKYLIIMEDDSIRNSDYRYDEYKHDIGSMEEIVSNFYYEYNYPFQQNDKIYKYIINPDEDEMNNIYEIKNKHILNLDLYFQHIGKKFKYVENDFIDDYLKNFIWIKNLYIDNHISKWVYSSLYSPNLSDI
jgi:hypothetical protein